MSLTRPALGRPQRSRHMPCSFLVFSGASEARRPFLVSSSLAASHRPLQENSIVVSGDLVSAAGVLNFFLCGSQRGTENGAQPAKEEEDSEKYTPFMFNSGCSTACLVSI